MFDNIERGDIVLLNGHSKYKKLVKVVNVTKTQITIERIERNAISCSKVKIKFNRRNGDIIGSNKFELFYWITPIGNLVPQSELQLSYEAQEKTRLITTNNNRNRMETT